MYHVQFCKSALAVYSTTGTMGIASRFGTRMQIEEGDEQSDSNSVNLPVSTAGWTGLRKAHMLDDLHEFRALAERIEARILSKREELHVPLPAGPIEPFHGLAGFAQGDVGRGNIVGRHTLAR